MTETEIKAAGDATFDAGNHVATFLGGVTVNDPRFTMTSQKLTVYLRQEARPELHRTIRRPAGSSARWRKATWKSFKSPRR